MPNDNLVIKIRQERKEKEMKRRKMGKCNMVELKLTLPIIVLNINW